MSLEHAPSVCSGLRPFRPADIAARPYQSEGLAGGRYGALETARASARQRRFAGPRSGGRRGFNFLELLMALSISAVLLTATMAALAILTMVLTQPMSNAAAALVMLPVAISTAQQLGVDPRSFAVLVTLSASLSFIAPLEPACLLVFAPGKYRFTDFVKVGLPMTLITLVVLLVLVPLLWPL